MASKPRSAILQVIGRNTIDGWPYCMELGFHPPNAWWETEAETILQGQDLMSIAQIVRFGLCRQDSLRGALQHRTEPWLDQILLRLRRTQVGVNHQAEAELNRCLKIEKILDAVEPIRPSSPSSWNWKPFKAQEQTDPGEIATDINEDSRSLFRKVPFEDWLKYSIGYQEDSVRELFSEHRILCVRLRSYLVRHPEETNKYVAVWKVSRIHCCH